MTPRIGLSITDEYSVAAPGAVVNEDAYGYSSVGAWVIDGATAPPGVRIDTGEFVRRASRAIAEHMSERGLRAVLRTAIESISRESEAGPAPTASVCLVRLQGSGLAWASLGDVTLIVRRPRALLVAGDFGSIEREQSRLSNATTDLSAFWNTTTKVRETANTPKGYWILSDRPEAADHAFTGRIQVGRGDEVLLVSDGISRIVDLFHELTWLELLHTAAAHGIGSVVARVRALENEDEGRRSFPRAKVSDDATGLLLRVE